MNILYNGISAKASIKTAKAYINFGVIWVIWDSWVNGQKKDPLAVMEGL